MIKDRRPRLPSCPRWHFSNSSVTVPLAPADAFRLFTDEMAGWWPLPTHSVYAEAATGVVIEPRVGGRIYETTADGRTADWGVVSAWEPGERFATSWHPGNDPARSPPMSTCASPRHLPGGTAVDLVHTGWELRGVDAPKIAAGYDTGWKLVLGRFVEAAASGRGPRAPHG